MAHGLWRVVTQEHPPWDPSNSAGGADSCISVWTKPVASEHSTGAQIRPPTCDRLLFRIYMISGSLQVGSRVKVFVLKLVVLYERRIRFEAALLFA
jgi:hypothetical protein